MRLAFQPCFSSVNSTVLSWFTKVSLSVLICLLLLVIVPMFVQPPMFHVSTMILSSMLFKVTLKLLQLFVFSDKTEQLKQEGYRTLFYELLFLIVPIYKTTNCKRPSCQLLKNLLLLLVLAAVKLTVLSWIQQFLYLCLHDESKREVIQKHYWFQCYYIPFYFLAMVCNTWKQDLLEGFVAFITKDHVQYLSTNYFVLLPTSIRDFWSNR